MVIVIKVWIQIYTSQRGGIVGEIVFLNPDMETGFGEEKNFNLNL